MDTYNNNESWYEITESEENLSFRLNFAAVKALSNTYPPTITSKYIANPSEMILDELIKIINKHALQGEYLPLTVLVETLKKHASSTIYVPKINIKFLYFHIKDYVDAFKNTFTENDFALLLEANRTMIACYQKHKNFYLNKIIKKLESYQRNPKFTTKAEKIHFQEKLKIKAKAIIEKEAIEIFNESIELIKKHEIAHPALTLLTAQCIQFYTALGLYDSAEKLIEKHKKEYPFELCEEYYIAETAFLYQKISSEKLENFSPADFFNTVLKYYYAHKDDKNFDAYAHKEILHWTYVYLKIFNLAQKNAVLPSEINATDKSTTDFPCIIKELEKIYNTLPEDKITTREQEKLLEIFISSQQFDKALELTHALIANPEKLSVKLYELMITAYFCSGKTLLAYNLLETAFAKNFFQQNQYKLDTKNNSVKLDPRDFKLVEGIGKVDEQSLTFLSLVIHRCLQKVYEHQCTTGALNDQGKDLSNLVEIILTYSYTKFKSSNYFRKAEFVGENTRRNENAAIVKYCINNILHSHYGFKESKIHDYTNDMRSTLTVMLDNNDFDTVFQNQKICDFTQMQIFLSNAEKLVKELMTVNNNQLGTYSKKGEPRKEKSRSLSYSFKNSDYVPAIKGNRNPHNHSEHSNNKNRNNNFWSSKKWSNNKEQNWRDAEKTSVSNNNDQYTFSRSSK
ncbi:MAG: hypothetical protein Tsb005_14550 [Gammaproteobacteria bacterium]